MQRFLLLVSFVVALLFAFTTTALFAGQEPGKDGDRHIKQRDVAKYSSLAKALKATQTPLDQTKVSNKSKKSKIKSAKHKSTSKKLASHKSTSSKKASYKKRSTSKSHSYRKAKSMKKPSNYKKRTAKKTT